jgi:hypothetical protein
MSDTDEPTGRAVSDHVEDVARAAATLTVRSAELEAIRHEAEVHRATRAATALVVLAAAAAGVFAFANWAVERALASSLSGWRAPAVLAGFWLVVAVVAAVVVTQAEPWLMRIGRRTSADPDAALAEREAAVDEAQQRLRDAVESLTGAVASQAAREVADAMLPIEGVADAGEKVVNVSDEALEYVDDITDVVEARVPGGVVVNRAFDIALIPGRYSVRAARIALNYGAPREKRPRGK